MEEMDSNVSPWNTGLKWGVISVLVALIIGYIQQLNLDITDAEAVKKSGEGVNRILGILPLIAGVVIAQLEHRKKDLGGAMSFGRAVGVGSIVLLAYTIIQSIYMYISLTIIFPELLSAMKQIGLDEMAKNPNVSQDDMDQAAGWIDTVFSPTWLTLITFFFQAFVGIIIVIITSLFTRKDPVIE